ncbi:Glycogen debranching enzyme / Pullulanase [Vagococcus fluvialis bH819]|uniref:pullulanase n=2 Tax=Enterococcaceae TaxID=81852 RepID=A0A1X6WKC3_9ENTE|nr:Glycogen debranching enzyme / Pullulanase [Vagococcus fluvialis bH819]
MMSLLFICSFSLQKSFAEEVETQVIIHYEAPEDEKNIDRNIWIWPENGAGEEHSFEKEDAFGKYQVINLKGAHAKVGFLIKSKGDWSYQSKDQWIETSSGRAHVWLDKEGKMSYEPNKKKAPKNKELNINVHYFRKNQDYDNWQLTLQTDSGKSQVTSFNSEDDYGKNADFKVTSEIDFSKLTIKLEKRNEKNEVIETDGKERVVYLYENQGNLDMWLMEGDELVYAHPELIIKTQKIKTATIEKMNQIDLVFSKPETIEKLKSYQVKLINSKGAVSFKVLDKEKEKPTNRLLLQAEKNLDLAENYSIETENGEKIPVTMGAVVRTPEFDDVFYYEGELGSKYQKDQTNFTLWAPTAKSVELITYSGQAADSAEKEKFSMTKGDKGTFKTELSGDQDGLVYTYRLTFSDGKINESVDPYATAAIVNGNRSVVLSPNQTNISEFNRMPSFSNPVDAVIYEAHIRDLSIASDSGIQNKGKFLGVVESGTKNGQNQETGLDYLKSLGVTHVQFLPMYDYQTVDESQPNTPQFNWGYDPKNYNVPEGSYSTDATNPQNRIVEMKQMVKGLHDNNIRVIMDVVYNHVYEASSHAFNQTVPGYYFRYNEDGGLANGTGVGNDVASERKMAQKYIVDSVSYWARNYQIDGFRFDLMGILDVETMNLVRQELNKIDPSIIVLGEGWNMGTPLSDDQKAIQKNANKMPGIGHFNDSIRDSVKGSVFEGKEPGMINGKKDLEKIVVQNMLGGEGLEGYTDPSQLIQYVEAHDNLTLYDKLSLTNPEDTKEQRLKRHMLGTGIVLVSEGVPFIHAGQEFLRTKDGDENSYKSPDSVNQFDWNRPQEYNISVNFFKELVAFRQTEPLLRMSSYKEIKEKSTVIESKNGVIIYQLSDESKDLIIAINSNEVEKSIDKKLIKEFKPVITNKLENEKNELDKMLPLSLTIYKKDKKTTETTTNSETTKNTTTEEIESSATSTTKTSETIKDNSIETTTTSSTENKKRITSQNNTNNSQKNSKEGKQYFSDMLPKTGEQKTIFAFMGLLVVGASWLIFKRKN